MEHYCHKCGTRWIANEMVGCPTCWGFKKVELSGTLKLVNPKDYRFAPEGTVVTQRPATWWERFLAWLKRIF